MDGSAQPDIISVNPGKVIGFNPASGYTACYPNEIQVASMMGEWLFQNQTHKIYSGTTNLVDLRNHLIKDVTMDNGSKFAFQTALFPHLLALVVVIIIVSRLLHVCLHHVKLSRIVCQLIAGILIFSFLQKPKNGTNDYGSFDPKIRRVEHVVGSMGLLFSLFIAAVKFDPALILFQSGKKKPIILGISSALIPLLAGYIIYALQFKHLESFIEPDGNFIGNVVYPFCLTFPITLTDMLTELRLLNTELGRLALSSSMVQFIVLYWSFSISLVVFKQGRVNMIYGFVTFLAFLVMVSFIFLVIRPYARHIVHTTPFGTRVKDMHIYMIMIIVLVLALVSDMSGYIFVEGPVFMGLALPQGTPLGTALIERVDLVASEVLLPIVFLHEGVLFDWAGLKEKLDVVLGVEFIVLVMFIVKILTNIAAAMYCKMSFKDGFILGLMMNFRGIVDMLLFLGFTSEMHLMDNTAFTAMVLSCIMITLISVPLVAIYYKPLSAGKNTGLRTVQYLDSNDQFQLMACFYDNKSVPALLEFLESFSSSPMTEDSICMYILRIVQLHGCAESKLISHRNKYGDISWSQMDLVHNHFISFEQSKKRVTIMPFTSITPWETMHTDVCSLILEKNIALVIVPYPSKNSMADLETDITMRDLVPLVFGQAPCSVGVLVYHGATRIMTHSVWQYHIGVIFWGGPDDREAISIASRLASHPNVYLSISYFTGKTRMQQEGNDAEEQASNDKIIAELQEANAENNCVTISEIIIDNVEQAFSELHALRDLYDLLIVGRKQERLLLLCKGLVEFTESPELGMIGEMFATDIKCLTNLLVVHQHKHS